MKKIKCAVIGTGGRCRSIMKELLKHAQGNLEVAAVYDPEQWMRDKFFNDLNVPPVENSESPEAAINTPGVEWVIVTSPNSMHKDHILMGFAAGKNVFAEKPLATSIEDCQAIEKAHKAAGTMFATGFVLRYSPIYRKVKELLDAGAIGKIISIKEETVMIETGHDRTKIRILKTAVKNVDVHAEDAQD